jgi:hypothetical protein
MKTYYTDYPFHELGDEAFKPAMIREIELVSYDGDKYVKLKVEGITSSTKRCYVYTKFGRCGWAPIIPAGELNKLPLTIHD